MYRNAFRCVFAALLGLSLAASHAAERSSENDSQLRTLLLRYPAADTNRDGILTVQEAQAHRQKLREARELTRTAEPDHADVAYGPHERNVLDLWLAKGPGPRPLVIYIHGGGWVGGDKVMIPEGHVERLLAAGIHFASINYRFSTHQPFPAPMRDGGLAVQFLRHHATRYNIDPERIACYGGSAGAVTSLWLAFHEDFADPKATDPVLRQSTRLTCAGSIVGPTTMDKKTMDEWFGMKVVVHPAMYPFFGLSKGDDAALYSERIRRIAAQASPMDHLTKDDPPVFLDFPQDLTPLPPKHTPGEMVHHPLFGVKLKDAADRIGVEAVFQAKNRPQTQYADLVDFLIRKLSAQ
jgi:acetyl esterase